MDEFKSQLKVREKQLLQWKKEKEKALQAAPEGALRICSHDNRTQYYLRKEKTDLNGTYIRQNDLKTVQRLAQKEYDKKVLRAVEKELNGIKKYFANFPETTAEEVYGTLHKERQKLVMPVYEPEGEFVKRWENIEYEGKVFREDIPELYTSKGERVRSKSEWIIADLLTREGVPYRYECPVYLNEFGIIHPDFTVLNIRKRQEILWEHFGMMDDPEYIENALQKIAVYAQNGYFPGENLIFTYETRKNPLNQKLVQLMIRRYLLC